MKIEDEYPDVLQNIEFVVARHYRRNPGMTDSVVLRTDNALVQLYSAEDAGPPAKLVAVDGAEGDLLRNVKEMCDWRLGRTSLTPDQAKAPPIEPLDVPTLVLCLKRLVKSVSQWKKHAGRRGYLKFMTQFVR